MSDLDPKTFDVDAWLTGARLPERSVVVYGRADLLAVADDLQRRIVDAEIDEAAEYALGEQASAAQLREEYERLAEEFEASALTIRVRAVKDSETRALTARVERGEVRKEDRGMHEIAIAAVEPKFTIEQVRKLRETIGEGQTNKIYDAVLSATGQQPQVSPGFLPKRSGQGTGQE